MQYTIGEISEMLQIPISTLRYYDKEGLLPLVDRTPGNIRIFNEADVECLKMIVCLKNTGMQLKDIKQFFAWCEEGDSTISERYALFLQLRKKAEDQIAQLEKSLYLINYKCELYRLSDEKGTTNFPGLREELALKFPKREV